MTDKATFTRVSATGNLQSLITNYNANLDVLEGALDDSLSLSGKLPNSLTAPLDANSQRIINLADAEAAGDAVTKRQLDAIVAGDIVLEDVKSVDFDTVAPDVATTGRLAWNDTDGTLNLGLKGDSVTLQVGQEQVLRGVNKTGVDLTLAAYPVVRIKGAQGQRVEIERAQASTAALSEGTIGLVTETIANNAEGFVCVMGSVRNINTTGSLQGETWADGDTLWLSQGTLGGVTKVKPASGILCRVGVVEHAHITQGKLYVHVENYSGLQPTLISGTNIKTINSTSLLGSGNIVISGGGVTTNAVTFNNAGTGAASGTTFDGSIARTISYNTIGAASLASPTFTGTPAGPTAAVGTNTTQLATTAFVNAEIANDALVLTGNQTAAGNKTFSGTTALALASTVDAIAIGYRNIPRVTDVLTDGKCFATAAGVTVNTGPAAGTAYSIYNNSAAGIVITQGAGLTLRLGGTATTGNYTLPQRGFITVWFNSTTEAIIL